MRQSAVLQFHPSAGHACLQTIPNLHIATPVGTATKDDLAELAASIKWDCTQQWTIVYDTGQQHNLEAAFPHHPKIKEIFYQADGIKGNSQRNRALEEIRQGLVYFLDDDNVVHPHFWEILHNITLGHITTFDQARTAHDGGVLKGKNVVVNGIDTAMFVIDRALIGHSRFMPFEYSADGIFVQEVLQNHPSRHVYIPEVAAFYNYRTQFFPISY